jgi:hypothetical protein
VGTFTGVAYPAASPNVIGVGGTTFSRNQVTGSYQSQATWNVNYSLADILYGTGGGPSAYEPRPAFQAGIEKIVGKARGTPDLTALADISTGVWVYNSTYSSNPASKGIFYQMGGPARRPPSPPEFSTNWACLMRPVRPRLPRSMPIPQAFGLNM